MRAASSCAATPGGSRTLVSLVDVGTLRLDVSARYPLAELARAHALGEAGRLRSKALVVVEE